MSVLSDNAKTTFLRTKCCLQPLALYQVGGLILSGLYLKEGTVPTLRSSPLIILLNGRNLNPWQKSYNLTLLNSYERTLYTGLESPVQSYMITDDSLITKRSETCVKN